MNKTDEMLAHLINVLAHKMDANAHRLYAVMVKQAWIDGIKDVIGILITGLLLGISIWITANEKKKYNSKYGDFWDDNFYLAIICGFLSFVFVVTLLVAGGDLIDCFFNPEYYALHQLISK